MFNVGQFLPDFSLAGKAISLEELLVAKEQRAWLQQQCLRQYHQSLLSLTLLAPGEVKNNKLLDYVFAQALAHLEQLWQILAIKPTTSFIRPLDTGHEAIFVLDIDATKLKQQTILLEESLPLARLWDIDVFDKDGKLFSRSEFGYKPRSCLVCQAEAKRCARSRQHSLSDIYQIMQQIVTQHYFADYVANLVNQALLTEARLTPKPGLVDQADNGAHQDMNLATFLLSSQALYSFWAAFVYQGIKTAQQPVAQILAELRPLGLQAELAMFNATQGINTHKGSIFAFGLTCAALGRLFAQQSSFNWQTLSSLIAQMCQGISQELEQPTQSATAGIKIYQHYGIKGARGEAEQGFPLVQYALSELLQQNDYDEQHRLLLALLQLFANNQDTNVIHRAGMEGLNWFRSTAQQLLKQEQVITKIEVLQQALNTFNQQCIHHNISPGGSADLLALSWFIYQFFYFKH